jgi:GDP-mannose pyrophosphatase NudK
VTVDRVHYEQTMRDGSVVAYDREVSRRGDGVTTLLYHPERGTVLLLRQPRIVSTLRGDATGETLEACNGLLGDATLEEGARREVIEETGYVPMHMQHVGSVYESPGGSSDLIHLFLAEYGEERSGPGGGLSEEGEEIDVLEVPFAEALRWMQEGTIRDARTMLVLQHLALRGIGKG